MINWNAGEGEVLNDYTVAHLQALAFPTLFPFGVGGATNKDRHIEVTLTEVNNHILK